MPNGVCRKRGVRIHKMELHVYLIVFVAKIYLKNAKILLNFVEIFFLNLQSGNNLLPAKNPKLFEMRWGAKLFQIGGGLESPEGLKLKLDTNNSEYFHLFKLGLDI